MNFSLYIHSFRFIRIKFCLRMSTPTKIAAQELAEALRLMKPNCTGWSCKCGNPPNPDGSVNCDIYSRFFGDAKKSVGEGHVAAAVGEGHVAAAAVAEEPVAATPKGKRKRSPEDPLEAPPAPKKATLAPATPEGKPAKASVTPDAPKKPEKPE